MAYPSSRDPKEPVIPVGAWVEIYLREPFADMASVLGNVLYVGPYGIRLETERGTDVYIAHPNVLGAVERRR